VWRKNTGEVLHRLPCGEPAGFVRLAFDRDGRHLARDCAGRFAIFDLETGERRRGFGAGWTSQIVFGSRHVYLIAQGDVESLLAFDLASGAAVPIGFKDRTPARLVISPDGRFLATSCRWLGGERPADCAVRLFDLPNLTPLLSQREPDESRLAFSGDGAYMAVRVGGVMRIWETATQLLLATFPFPDDARFQFAKDPSRLFVESAADARVLDTFGGDVLAVFPGGRRIGDDPRIPGAVSVAGSGFAETWRIQPLDKTGFRETAGRAHRLQFDGSGRYFAVCTSVGVQEPDWRVSVWDVGSSARLSESPADECEEAFQSGGRGFTFRLPDGSVVVLARPGRARSLVRDPKSRTLRLLDEATGKVVFDSPFSPLSVAWSDDATLVLGANRQELRIWRISDGTLLLTRPVPPNAARFAFAPDNRSVLIAWGRSRTRLGLHRLYSWRLEDTLAETCAVLRGSLRSRFDRLRPDAPSLRRACPNQAGVSE
jgi:WD40 repeat protein